MGKSLCQDNKNNYAVILGDPGSGKSSLLQYLALDWAQKNQNERWHQEVISDVREREKKQCRLLEAIEEKPSIQLLAGNPLLLTLMVLVNHHQELPRKRIELYKKASELLLHQWDVERGIKLPNGQEIDLRAKREILQRVAYFMQIGTNDSKAANIIHGNALTKIITEYLREYLGIPQGRLLANELVRQLRSRNFILCDMGGDSYAFVHRTFMEYFCAFEFAERFNSKQNLSLKKLQGLFLEHANHDDWREVLRLLCGQLDENFTCQIIQHLVDSVDLQTWDKQSAVPEYVLAIGCLTEANQLNRLGKVGGYLLQQLIGLLKRIRPEAVQLRYTWEIWDKNPIQKFLLEDLIGVSREISQQWPGLPDVSTIKTQTEHWPPGCVQEFWPQFVAQIFGSREWLIELSNRTTGFQSWRYRRAALQALAQHWVDEETRELLFSFWGFSFYKRS